MPSGPTINSLPRPEISLNPDIVNTNVLWPTVADLRKATSRQSLREALCRYFKRGRVAGCSTGELVDMLCVSTPSLLEQAGFEQTRIDEALQVLAELTDEEIEAADVESGDDV